MAKGSEITTMPPLPVAFPSHIRSFIRAIPPGSVVDVLRDDVAIARLEAEGSAVNLDNFRRLVSQSVERDGHARFTICVDDREVALDSSMVVDAHTSATDGAWQAFAQKMEGIAFRALERLDEKDRKNADNLEKILDVNRKLVKANAKLVSEVSELIRHDLERIDEARDGKDDSDGEMEKLKFAAEMLGGLGSPMGGGGAGGVAATREKFIAALKPEEKTAALKTLEGQAFMEATTSLGLKLAVKGLFGLVTTGKLTISRETAAACTAIINGEA